MEMQCRQLCYGNIANLTFVGLFPCMTSNMFKHRLLHPTTIIAYCAFVKFIRLIIPGESRFLMHATVASQMRFQIIFVTND